MTKSWMHIVLAIFWVSLFSGALTFLQFHFKLHNHSNLISMLCLCFGVVVSFEHEFFLDRPIDFLKKLLDKPI